MKNFLVDLLVIQKFGSMSVWNSKIFGLQLDWSCCVESSFEAEHFSAATFTRDFHCQRDNRIAFFRLLYHWGKRYKWHCSCWLELVPLL